MLQIALAILNIPDLLRSINNKSTYKLYTEFFGVVSRFLETLKFIDKRSIDLLRSFHRIVFKLCYNVAPIVVYVVGVSFCLLLFCYHIFM